MSKKFETVHDNLTLIDFGLNTDNPSDQLIISAANGDPLLVGMLLAKEKTMDRVNDPSLSRERREQIIDDINMRIQKRQSDLGITLDH